MLLCRLHNWVVFRIVFRSSFISSSTRMSRGFYSHRFKYCRQQSFLATDFIHMTRPLRTVISEDSSYPIVVVLSIFFRGRCFFQPESWTDYDRIGVNRDTLLITIHLFSILMKWQKLLVLRGFPNALGGFAFAWYPPMSPYCPEFAKTPSLQKSRVHLIMIEIVVMIFGHPIEFTKMMSKNTWDRHRHG